MDSLYVKCEECAIEGVYNSVFDRSVCRSMLEDWKSEELRRRGQKSADPSAAVAVCPSEATCSGPLAHKAKVVDILAVKVQRSSLPCPRCVSKGILPPYCFQRTVCTAELEVNRGGTLPCKRCGDSVSLFELLRSEVFISYNWGAQCCPECSMSYWSAKPLSDINMCTTCKSRWPKTQIKSINQVLVGELKHKIEEEAGVTCWHDTDRLMGGKDLVKEMEAGIRCAEVVIIFLTDAYVRSVNCMKEYHFATKHGKYIIPVLLKDFCGAAAVASALSLGNLAAPSLDVQDADTGVVVGGSYSASMDDQMEWWPSDMKSLSQFQPLPLLSEEQTEDVVQEICERIQSRFHRSQRYPTADDAVDFLRDYNSWKATRSAFVGDNLSKMKRGKLEQYLTELFEEMDRDGSGFLEEEELAAHLDRQMDKEVCTKEQILALIAEADVDCDGQLSVEEFKAAMLSALSEGKR